MTKHTEGPWELIEWDDRWPAVQRQKEGGFQVIGTNPKSALADARLIASAPDLLEAAIVQHECGPPSAVMLYDEEGIEGWRWTHPDGRDWEETGDWSEPVPMHPMMAAAIAKATGEQP